MNAPQYATIANIIRTLPEDSATRSTVAKHFAEKLGEESPRFKRDRFLDACGCGQGDTEE